MRPFLWHLSCLKILRPGLLDMQTRSTSLTRCTREFRSLLSPRGYAHASPRLCEGCRPSIFRPENARTRRNRLSGKLPAHRQRRQLQVERQRRHLTATVGRPGALSRSHPLLGPALLRRGWTAHRDARPTPQARTRMHTQPRHSGGHCIMSSILRREVSSAHGAHKRLI